MHLVDVVGPRADAFVSVVVVFEDGERSASQRITELGAQLAKRYRNYEIVIVDNRLPSDLIVELRDLLPHEPCLRVLRLARRSSIDTAVFAGLDAAIGDHVVVTTPAYDPVSAVLEVLGRLRDGSHVVEGASIEPLGGGAPTRAARRLFYWYNRRFLDVAIPARATYLTGFTRTAVNALSASARTHRYLHHLVRHIGFRIERHDYRLLDVSRSRTTSRSRAVDAIEMISSYSTHPLRVVTAVGLTAALLNLLYALYVIVVTLSARVTAGWPTTSLQLSAMFFLICVILAVQAEYVGRILSESRRESGYYVSEELESDTLIAESERRNVAHA